MDINAGKYRRFYKEEFNLAKDVLDSFGGDLSWSNKDYEAFRYKDNDIILIFYPHKTTAGNYHIRIRSQSKNNVIGEANKLMKLLYKSIIGCTFTYRKQKSKNISELI